MYAEAVCGMPHKLDAVVGVAAVVVAVDISAKREQIRIFKSMSMLCACLQKREGGRGAM